MGQKVRLIFGDNKIASRRNNGIGGKRKTDPIDKLPTGKVDRISPFVIKLHILIILISRNWRIHQLVDNDVSRFGTGAAIAGATRRNSEFPERVRAVRQPSD